MIETANLSKHFGSIRAVDGIDLRVREGEVFALLGPNGAGKTTTVRMLAAILKPTTGWARVAGLDTVREARQVRQIVGLLTEAPGLYTRMRALEYLDFFGQLYRLPSRQRAARSEQLLRRFDLWDARHRRLGEYSKGMRQKLALVRAMLHDPLVLFLDEPTSAMDPYSARQVREAILELRRESRTIVLCTHNLSEAEALADRIAIIRRGRIAALGSISELKRRLLGDPLFELRLGTSLDGLLPLLEDLVQLREYGNNWARYTTPMPETVNPQLMQRLIEHGVPVITLSEVPRNLEEVYLRIVNDKQSDAETYHQLLEQGIT
ncbi:MAG: ABC transporter ATP-binding protein [Anaerolineae bacterium]|nr:ABC transporter ATP-binding protein [Anaerolineae bacterium]